MLTYVNEYQMAQSIYILYGDSRTWLDAIRKAQVRRVHTVVHRLLLKYLSNVQLHPRTHLDVV